MTAILGISAFYHDSAAALVIDGEIVAAAQEERFTRRKHDANFPQRAVGFCLQQGGLESGDLDYVGFYDKPIRKFERLLETYLAFAPSGYRSLRRALPVWLKQKLHLPKEITRGLNGLYKGPIVFTDHHESHAASAFFPSPFESAAILTLDGVGEWSTTCWGEGHKNRIELKQEIRFPHSIGLLYSAFTYYIGFRVNSGEYKVMGLAPYGRPIYREKILDHLIDLKDDGSFRMDMDYFNYCQGLTMTSAKFHRLFDGPPRRPESKITQREMDLAASVQSVTEEVVLRLSNHIKAISGMKNLAMAGGVALNCVGNGRVLRESNFDNVWIQPAAGDAGGALGAAMFIWFQLLENERTGPVDHTPSSDRQQASLLGPAFSDDQIRDELDRQQGVYRTVESDEDLCEQVAVLMADGKVVGWFQGRMEFGPRALGARSILGDARCERMQSVMNLKVKFRESFRPFAPVVLREAVDEYFEMRPREDSPYMLLVAPVKERHRLKPESGFDRAFGIEKLNYARSSIPAVTHVDYSSRVQTIDETRHPLVHQLISKFRDLTGCPILINTSFNVRGEPIVCSPHDAWRCFMNTDMDVLAIGRQILIKEQQTVEVDSTMRKDHLSQFQLD
ncbi:MAG: carbamoyltransferase [Pirellulaceae bacterium]